MSPVLATTPTWSPSQHPEGCAQTSVPQRPPTSSSLSPTLPPWSQGHTCRDRHLPRCAWLLSVTWETRELASILHPHPAGGAPLANFQDAIEFEWSPRSCTRLFPKKPELSKVNS